MRRLITALVILLTVSASLRIPAVHADPFSDTFSVTYTACTTGGGCNGDGNIDVGEPLGTTLHSSLDAANGSFYDTLRIVSFGVTPTGTVPAGDVVGSGAFTTHVVSGTPCSAQAPAINPVYSIYATQDANSPGYPSQGYAHGLASGESWSAISAAGWIQDFDDDNNNNVPDFLEGGSGASTLQMTVRDISPADGVPDGVTREPLYLPLLDAVIGQTHAVRYFADTVINPGVFEVPIDFVMYRDFPAAGDTSIYPMFGESLFMDRPILPLDYSTPSLNFYACPPFTMDSTFNALSSAGHVVQTATAGSGTVQFELSTMDDYDGDGVPNYQDNCDTIPNPAQSDTDGDGIGDACDPNPGVPAPADADGDGFPNFIDSCPTLASNIDTDGDGVTDPCDLNPNVQGNGDGYPVPAPGVYDDHDAIQSTSYSLPRASGPLPTATETIIKDANDNHVPEALDYPAGDPTNCGPGSAAPCYTIGDGVTRYDSDGDGMLDNADPDQLAIGDLGGFWEFTYTGGNNGLPNDHCGVNIPAGTVGSFSNLPISCTTAALGTVSGDAASSTITFTYAQPPSPPTPVIAVTSDAGQPDLAANTWSGTWSCISPPGCGGGTFVGVRIPDTYSSGPLPSTGGQISSQAEAPYDNTLVTFPPGVGTGTNFTMTLQALSAAMPLPATVKGAMLTAYEFSPSTTFSPCTATGPGGVPAGSGGPQLRFDVTNTQVVWTATPYTVFVWNGVTNQWDQDNAVVTSDGNGGFFVTTVVCHFSEYAIMGPAMVPARSVGGIAERPPVAVLATPTSGAAARIRSAFELSLAAVAMLGFIVVWRRWRRRATAR